MRYNVSSVSLDELRRIIWASWEAVPNSYIESLVVVGPMQSCDPGKWRAYKVLKSKLLDW